MAVSRYLDFDVLARIDNMQLLAKSVVEGFILGLHRSPFRGFSVEFAEYRQYVAGDDIKYIDWKVFAKSDRYYIKQFEAETNSTCHILLDASGSMGYRGAGDDGKGLTKLEYGSYLAACLAYFMMNQRDPVGLTIFDNAVRVMLPPRMRQSHLQRMLGELDQLHPGTETDIARPMHDLADGLKRRGLVILISDLMDDPERVLSALQHFRFQGHDVLVFHIMDDAELEFSFTTMTEFTDLESGEKLLVSPEGMRDIYLGELKRFLAFYEKGCADLRADYKLLPTSTPLEVGLSEYLYRRSRMQ